MRVPSNEPATNGEKPNFLVQDSYCFTRNDTGDHCRHNRKETDCECGPRCVKILRATRGQRLNNHPTTADTIAVAIAPRIVALTATFAVLMEKVTCGAAWYRLLSPG
jgi:hypothetical protein